jgi:pyruvate formate lyase activating enzyme
MKIAGIHYNSLIDYPGKISAIIFTPGCNMDCFYCHNKVLINPENNNNYYDINETLAQLKRRKKLLDAVVISGGEPTLHLGIEKYITQIKNIGYLVKLDTNGTNPDVIRNLVNKKLVNYIAMDIKAPFERYEEISGTSLNIEKIKESISFLMEDNVSYEFRTTVAPTLEKEDIISIANSISGAERYILQQYRKPEILKSNNSCIDIRLMKPPHSPEYLNSILDEIRPLVNECQVRGYKL